MSSRVQDFERQKHSGIYSDREINLSQWWKILVEGRLTILILSSLALVLSAAIVWTMPNIYRAEALLVPATAEDSGGMSGIVGQFGGLASLAGVSLGSDTVGKTDLALEVLKSRVFINGFVDKHDIVVPLLAGKGWDNENEKWILDESVYDIDKDHWSTEFLSKGNDKPSRQRVYKKFKSLLSVIQDKKSKLVYIGIDIASPVAAKQWVDWLVADLNVQIKQRDMENARKSIGYLQTQIEKTPVKEMQQIFYQLIEEQTKQMMLAELRDEYVLTTVDPAVVPEEKIAPGRIAICFFATLLGVFLGIVLVSLKHFWVANGYREHSGAN